MTSLLDFISVICAFVSLIKSEILFFWFMCSTKCIKPCDFAREYQLPATKFKWRWRFLFKSGIGVHHKKDRIEIILFIKFEVLSFDCNHVEGFGKIRKIKDFVWIWPGGHVKDAILGLIVYSYFYHYNFFIEY